MLRFLYIIFILSTVGCSGINLTEPIPEPKRESIFGAPLTFSTETNSFSTGNLGIPSLSNLDTNNNRNLSSMPVNELLWRSTLDTLDFMSFEDIDPYSGVIITNWFINETSTDIRNKVTVSFTSSELNASSFKVSFIRERLKDGKWVSDGYSDGLAKKIEDLILYRARELRSKS